MITLYPIGYFFQYKIKRSYHFFAELLLCTERDTIECGQGQKIKIISANYGRNSTTICKDIVPILTINCSVNIEFKVSRR